jgi:hypothetical protein
MGKHKGRVRKSLAANAPRHPSFLQMPATPLRNTKTEQTAYKQPATDSAGSPMPQNETNQECQSFVTQSAGTPTRDSCSGMSGTTELDLPFPLKDYLVPRTWHKPYAEALLETDPSKMAALILVAEDAILDRSVEIQTCPTPIEESHDLESALQVLSRLRKSEMAV